MGEGSSRRGWLRALLGGLLGPWLARRVPAAGIAAREGPAVARLPAAPGAWVWVMVYSYDGRNQQTSRVPRVLPDPGALPARPGPLDPRVRTYTYDARLARGTPGERDTRGDT